MNTSSSLGKHSKLSWFVLSNAYSFWDLIFYETVIYCIRTILPITWLNEFYRTNGSGFDKLLRCIWPFWTMKRFWMFLFPFWWNEMLILKRLLIFQTVKRDGSDCMKSYTHSMGEKCSWNTGDKGNDWCLYFCRHAFNNFSYWALELSVCQDLKREKNQSTQET